MENPTYPDQAETLGALLRSPYRKLSRHVYERVATGGFPGIRPSHSAVFRHISPDGTRLTALAGMADMTKQSMAYLVSHLEANGYLRITADPSDGRAKLVKLTAKGRRLIVTLIDASAEAELNMAKVIGAREMAALRRGLAALDAAADSL